MKPPAVTMKFNVTCDDYASLVDIVDLTIRDFFGLDDDDPDPNVVCEIVVEESDSEDVEERYTAEVIAKVRDARS